MAQGEVRIALAQGLKVGPATTRELALRTRVGVTKAMYTLRDMVRSGQVRKVASVRRPGVKRPVPVYGLVEVHPTEPTTAPGAALQSALAAWRG